AVSTGYSEAGHIDGHYFLGQISRDPGPLFYLITWLWRTSPVELVGLLALLVAAWPVRRGRSAIIWRQEIRSHLVLLALALFIGMLLIFETLSSKKMDRYFLPAFPVIEVFAAFGLLWLWDRLLRRLPDGFAIRGLSLHPSPFASSLLRSFVLVGIILLVQGGLVLANYPYYFTYYNPLLGGAS